MRRINRDSALYLSVETIQTIYSVVTNFQADEGWHLLNAETSKEGIGMLLFALCHFLTRTRDKILSKI